MQKFSPLIGGVLASTLATAATFTPTDMLFNDNKTRDPGDGRNQFKLVRQTNYGSGKLTLHYAYTVDLSTVGGQGYETAHFSVDFETKDGIIPSTFLIGVSGDDDSTEIIDPGETLKATLNFQPQSVFKDVKIGVAQMWGDGDAQVAGVTKADKDPVFIVQSKSFTVENVDPDDEAFGLGFLSFTIEVDGQTVNASAQAPVPATAQVGAFTTEPAELAAEDSSHKVNLIRVSGMSVMMNLGR
ncbi:hypothetical protein [Rubritalea marina]|uniref:hypothetical protein n=1 Tax=Rubritalea marina TaxID=361055 RepID=UPI00036CEC52|nr:hypothetical protein [Rubritalea marina]